MFNKCLTNDQLGIQNDERVPNMMIFALKMMNLMQTHRRRFRPERQIIPCIRVGGSVLTTSILTM